MAQHDLVAGSARRSPSRSAWLVSMGTSSIPAWEARGLGGKGGSGQRLPFATPMSPEGPGRFGGMDRTVAPGRWQGHAPTSCPSGLPLDLQNKGSPMPSRDCATHVSQCSVFATALPRAVANHIPKEEEFRGPQVAGDSPVTYIVCMLVYAYPAAWGMKARRTSQRPTPAQLPPSAELLSPPGWKREGASEIWESIPARYRGLRQKEIGLEKSFSAHNN